MTPGKAIGNNYLRIFDANCNRCREGLRVIEDTARFVIEDDAVYRRARALRHRVDRITRDIYPSLLKVRDSRGDPGRRVREGCRENPVAVMAANFRRAEESLRVLEEYSRLVAPAAGPAFKKIRFAVYTLEKKLCG